MISIDNLWGLEFLDFIQAQQQLGKTLSQIAAEHGKTYDALRSKIRREKKKVASGVPVVPQRDSVRTKCTAGEKKEVSVQVGVQQETIEEKGLTLSITNFNTINNKLDFLINKLENNPGEVGVQVVAQELPYKLEYKKEFVKTSARVERETWERFLNFCKEHKQNFKQQDLITLALQEFLQKYNK